MLRRFYCAALVAALMICLTPLTASAAMSASEKKAAQAEVQKVTKQVLTDLYALQPSAKDVIAKSAGYAVFSNFGMKIFFAGGGKGQGVAVNNATKKSTYMKMVEVQAGLGIGIKKFRLVWVFETQKALNDFVNSGWEMSAQTTAAAKDGARGMAMQGALSVSPGVWVYQMTDQGLALEITGKGTKYYKDDDLN